MLQSALFQYNRRVVVNINGEEAEVTNPNFINPLQVQSCFWELNDRGEQILNIFLPTKTVVFGKTLGERFLKHYEAVINHVAGIRGDAVKHPTKEQNQQQRRSRPAIEEEVADDIPNQPAAVTWENNPS